MESSKKKAGQVIIDVLLIVIIVALLETAAYLLYKQMNPNNTVILKHQVTQEDNTFSWEKLRAVNSDVIGWLTIPGTGIDTPIVQTTDNDKYLYTSFQGEYDERGVPFLDYEYQWDPKSCNSVVYGHSTLRSKVPTMFDEVLYYFDEPDLINTQNLILFNRPEELGGDGIFSIFAVITVEADYDYRQMDFNSEDEFVAYYDRIKAEALTKREDIVVQPGDEILTLSTCNFRAGLEDGRTAVIAKRIK